MKAVCERTVVSSGGAIADRDPPNRETPLYRAKTPFMPNVGIAACNPFHAEPTREEACRERLRDYLTRVGQEPIELNVEQLFSLDSGVCDRFNYFVPRLPDEAKKRLLVSGCAAASEMIIGRRFGFRQIFGTEIVREYVEISQARLEGNEDFGVVLYDGTKLPFEDESFTCIASGHIIEHTRSPYEYLREHMRVLQGGGYFFLEFPNRYHRTELHTRLPSLEYLPKPIRSIGLRFLASRFSFAPQPTRERYDAIRRTLQPVSVWQIKAYLARMKSRGSVIHQYAPAAGYTRLIIAK